MHIDVVLVLRHGQLIHGVLVDHPLERAERVRLVVVVEADVEREPAGPRPSSSFSIMHSTNGTSPSPPSFGASPPFSAGTRQMAGLISGGARRRWRPPLNPKRSSMNLAERGDEISSASEIDEMTCRCAAAARRPCSRATSGPACSTAERTPAARRKVAAAAAERRRDRVLRHADRLSQGRRRCDRPRPSRCSSARPAGPAPRTTRRG